jgi:hypothetical protein
MCHVDLKDKPASIADVVATKLRSWYLSPEHGFNENG